eukprot:Phypoly_transcript_12935.p1 GENE.Phypoly_transcript_12935~~Phypoly_transcript_12935.p1  ORF type:complete len:345 (+),score=67.13 Phypoly_transcript_12935:47-1081(+)
MPEGTEEAFLAPIPTPDEVSQHIALLIPKLDNENLAEKFEIIGHLRAIERDPSTAAARAIPSLLALLEKNNDTYDHVVVLMTLFCISNEVELAENSVLFNVLQFVPHDLTEECARLTGRLLERQAECSVYPQGMAGVYDTLMASLFGRIPIPLESTLKSIAWIARNPMLHNFILANDTVDIFLERLLADADAPESEYYFATLLALAERQEAARVQCGERGVNLALYGMQNGSVTAAKLLAALLDYTPNRETMRAAGGVEMVFAYTKQARSFEGIQILSKLAPSDMLIYGRMFVELSEVLEELHDNGTEAQQTVVTACIDAMTTIWEGLRNAQSLKERLAAKRRT